MLGATSEFKCSEELIQAAKEVDKVAIIAEEAKEVMGILDKELDLLAFLYTPAITACEKKKVISKIFKGKICNELINLLYVLIDKGSTKNIFKIINVYRACVTRKEAASRIEMLAERRKCKYTI